MDSLIFRRIAFVILILIFIFVVSTFISLIVVLFKIDVSTYKIFSTKIPKSFDGFRILQLSDLHNYNYGKRNKKLIKKINKTNPDIIVMTGDMVNADSTNFDSFFNLATELSKKYTCYYIMGNHELRLTANKQLEIIVKLQALGIQVLNNSTTQIFKANDNIILYGLIQPLNTYKNNFKNNNGVKYTLDNIKQYFPSVADEKFNILLTHSPFDFEVFANWGADLVLAGHVHGGSLRLPFIGGLLSPERSLFPKYSGGQYKINDSKMIVNRGLGDSTFKFRLFNNHEICVIELYNKKTD